MIEHEAQLAWSIPQEEFSKERIGSLDFRIDNRTLRFHLLYFLRLGEKELDEVVSGKARSAGDYPLLVVPELKSRMIDLCRARNISAVDLNGRTYIRAPGLLVDRPALPGRRFRYELEPRNIFAGKSARIVRYLLTDRDKVWTQGDLRLRTKTSAGLISRIVVHLIAQGYAEKLSPRTFRLTDVSGLIDAWIKADDFNRRVTVARFNVIGDSPIELARMLQHWAANKSVPIAFTQWIAGWLRQPFTEPVITSAYVGRLPDPASLQELGLRAVHDAGKVWLFQPDDEGVFLGTHRVGDLDLVSDAQVVLDLEGTGLRGPEQSRALRAWEGFCRP